MQWSELSKLVLVALWFNLEINAEIKRLVYIIYQTIKSESLFGGVLNTLRVWTVLVVLKLFLNTLV